METAKTLRKTITREEFRERVYSKRKSFGSQCIADCSLKTFDDFCLKEYQKPSDSLIAELREHQGDELYHFLQDFINFMDKKSLSISSIKTYFTFIRSYLRSQGIRIYTEDIRDMVRFPKQVKEMLEPLTKETIKTLLDYSNHEKKALYLTLLSSGMRIGEALSLRKKDFDFSSNPVMITIQEY